MQLSILEFLILNAEISARNVLIWCGLNELCDLRRSVPGKDFPTRLLNFFSFLIYAKFTSDGFKVEFLQFLLNKDKIFGELFDFGVSSLENLRGVRLVFGLFFLEIWILINIFAGSALQSATSVPILTTSILSN